MAFLVGPDGFSIGQGELLGQGLLLGNEGDPCCCGGYPIGGCTNCPEMGLDATYYNTDDLTGDVALERKDPDLNFDWGDGSPGEGVNADTFSVQWFGQIFSPVAGTYTFYATSESGCRVFVNGTKIIDAWTPHSEQTDSGTIALASNTSGNTIQVYFRHTTGDAKLVLEWECASGGLAREVIPAARFWTGTMNSIMAGLVGSYYPSLDLTGAVQSRVDSTINFTWAGTPHGSLPADNYSVRWEGYVLAPQDASVIDFERPMTLDVTFYLTTNDGARLWVDDELLIDQWTDQAGDITHTATPVTLRTGKFYSIRVEMYDRTGDGKIILQWSYPGQTQTVVSAAYLARGSTSEDTPGQYIATFTDVTLCPPACMGSDRFRINGGSANGTFCLTHRPSAFCQYEYREVPPTSVTVEYYEDADCSLGGSFVTNSPEAFWVNLQRGSLSDIVMSAAGFRLFYATTTYTDWWDCTQTLTLDNATSSACTATSVGADRGYGGSVTITPGDCG